MQDTFEEIEIKRLKEQEQLEEAKAVITAMANFVNYRKPNKAFIEAFKREHRTLQQSMFRMMLELVEDMASENYPTDGRNEASKQVAQALLKGFQMAKKQEYLNQGISKQRAEDYVSGEGAKPSKYLPFI